MYYGEFISSFLIDLQRLFRLDISIKEASRFGITTVLDAGTDTYPPNYSSENDYDGLDAYREFSNNKDASIRVAASQYAHPTLWRKHLPIIKKRKYDNDFVKQFEKYFG